MLRLKQTAVLLFFRLWHAAHAICECTGQLSRIGPAAHHKGLRLQSHDFIINSRQQLHGRMFLRKIARAATPGTFPPASVAAAEQFKPCFNLLFTVRNGIADIKGKLHISFLQAEHGSRTGQLSGYLILIGYSDGLAVIVLIRLCKRLQDTAVLFA